jgi:hypothetical protein
MIGTRVGCRRKAAAKGAWRKFDGRTGTIVAVNVARSVDPEWSDVTEIGVCFDGSGHAQAWFLPSELTSRLTGCVLSDVMASDAELGRAA